MRDVLNLLKENKSKFDHSVQTFSLFLRDWSGVEHEYSRKLLSLVEPSGALSRAEKISKDSLKEAIQMIKTFISGSSLIHSRFSKTIELLSTSEIPRSRFEFKSRYKELVEACKIAEQDYRKILTEYAVILVDNSEIVYQQDIDVTKVNIKEVQIKHKNQVKDIVAAIKVKIDESEDVIRQKVFEIIDQFDRSPQIIDEKTIEAIFNDQSTSEKVLSNWVTPRFKVVLQKIESNLTENLCVSDDFISQIQTHIKEIISSLNEKCSNSCQIWVPQVCQFMIGITERILNKTDLPLKPDKKIPEISEFLQSDEETCVKVFDSFFRASEINEKLLTTRILNRAQLLEHFGLSLISIFNDLPDSEFFLNKCQNKIISGINKFIESISTSLIKGEFFHIFLSLYQPNDLNSFIPTIKSSFDQINKSVSNDLFSKFLHLSFFKFIELWKISVLKIGLNKPSNEREQELKADTRNLSILFEWKQAGGVLGVPREVQKKFLQSQFDWISLSINSTDDLVSLFLSENPGFDRKIIAFVVICRGEKKFIKEIIENKGLIQD